MINEQTAVGNGATRASQRRERIAAHVNRRSFTRVTELSEQFDVSTVTVRADLELLERHGQLQRVRGGALPRGTGGPELPFEQTEVLAAAEKAGIGRLAADLVVESGQTVLLDVGTTTTAFARALAHRTDVSDVTVITNGLSVARELEPAIPRLRVVVTGGTLRPLQHSLISPLASRLLDGITADVVFLGCNGVDAEAGVTNANLPESEVKELMLARSRSRVVLADGSKLGRVSLARLCPLAEIDMLVTDTGADPELVRSLEESEMEVRQAEPVRDASLDPLSYECRDPRPHRRTGRTRVTEERMNGKERSEL